MAGPFQPYQMMPYTGMNEDFDSDYTNGTNPPPPSTLNHAYPPGNWTSAMENGTPREQPPAPMPPHVKPSSYLLGIANPTHGTPPFPRTQLGNGVEANRSEAIMPTPPAVSNGCIKRPHSAQSRSHMPSLRDILAQKEAQESSPSSLSGHRGDRSDTSDSNLVVSEMSDFTKAIFMLHADISGLSTVIAEYIAWAQREVESPRMMSKEGLGPVLQTLESRVRELSEVVKARPWEAWRTMIDNLERSDSQNAGLVALEGEMKQQMLIRQRFFDMQYDICRDLSLQSTEP